MITLCRRLLSNTSLPKRFEGHKLGILATGPVDANVLNGLTNAITKEKDNVEQVAAEVGGVQASDGSMIFGKHMIAVGPSSSSMRSQFRLQRIDELVKVATARDLVADAFQHCKFIRYDEAAMLLLEQAGITDALDEGVLALPGEGDLAAFVARLGKLRVRVREPSVKLGKASPHRVRLRSRGGRETVSVICN